MAIKPVGFELGIEIVEDDGSGSTQFLRGTVDPSQAGGRVAPVSSLYARDVGGSDGELYQKFGPAATDWKLIASGAAAGVIGAAEDADYTDGLFTDLVPSTPTGTAVDRINEVLKALAPPPAPGFDQISCANSGAAGNLSFGASNVIAGYANVDGSGGSTLDLNALFSVAGTRRGLFTGSTTVNGTLNDDVPAHATAYPANAFGDGDQGTLELEVNGVVVHTIDLTTFGNGSDTNVNGSGFNLLAATPVEFPDTTPLAQFQYRTGTWTVAPSEQVNGYNYVRVNHNFGSGAHWSGFIEWVNDPEATALTADTASLDTLVMSGSKFLSGVEYHTGGSAQYDVSIHACHRNVYSDNGSAVSFSVGNGSAPSQALANIVSETDDEVVINKAVTVANNGRLLDAALSISVNCQHPLKANLSGGAPQSLPGLLLDGVNTANTDVRERFCLEDYRMVAVAEITVNGYAAQADLGSGTWDVAVELSSADVGHNSGLLVYNGALRYPTQGLDSGDFRSTGDGNVNGAENGPPGNPNYNAIVGNKTFYREFVNNSGLTKANFTILLAGSGSFVSVAAGPSGQALTLEVKFPDGSITAGTGWLDAYEDFATANWADGDGCRNAGTGVGRSMGTTWGLTVGTKSIAAGESVVVRITAPDAWTGNINDIQLAWL